ncbi:MAG: hypothetical protein PWR10_1922 [Halanaerobiales bacterium]|nr:hypothetical protein [Halanaerobiales bacterium]
MRFEKFERIGIGTDWVAVILGLFLGFLVKFGIIGSVPW